MIKTFLNLVLPQTCIHCGGFSEDAPVCQACLNQLQPTLLRVTPDVVALFEYDGVIKTMLHYLKFEGYQQLGNMVSEVISPALNPFPLAKPDIVIPTPIHPKRHKKRGYNQVDLLFKSIFETQFPYVPALIRQQNTPPLFELSASEREKALQNAFRLDPAISVAGKRILLLDDIYTTGATMTEMTKILCNAGATQIMGLSLCRVKS